MGHFQKQSVSLPEGMPQFLDLSLLCDLLRPEEKLLAIGIYRTATEPRCGRWKGAAWNGFFHAELEIYPQTSWYRADQLEMTGEIW